MTELAEILESRGINQPLNTVLETAKGDAVLGIEVQTEAAVKDWETLRSLYDETKRWPVILGDQREVDYHKEFSAIPGTFDDELREGSEWLSYRRSPEYWKDLAKPQIEACKKLGIPIPEFMTRTPSPALRKAPGLPPDELNPRDEFTAHKQDEAGDSVFIALLPIANNWQATLFLGFGGWNSCPPPTEHATFHRYWFDKFGAETVTITHDTVEMRVSRPPLTWEQAFELAEDQSLYAEFDQFGELSTTRGLAASLMNARVWYFWWD